MSYGTNAPQGLSPVNYLGGATWNNQYTEYDIASGYATSLFTNDPVTFLADGTIGIAVAGGPTAGVFAGVKYYDALGNFQNLPVWTAATATLNGGVAKALIIDDPNVLFDIQCSVGNLTQLLLNSNANFVAGAGNSRTGLSGYALDFGTLAVGATLNLKVLHLTPNPTNQFGNYANVIVQINNNPLRGSTGSLGV